MKPPGEMSDRELDFAVARECFGQELPESWASSPTRDAGDAERVWDWLASKFRGVTVTRVEEERIVLVSVDRSVFVVKRGGWKRAICEAAVVAVRVEPAVHGYEGYRGPAREQ